MQHGKACEKCPEYEVLSVAGGVVDMAAVWVVKHGSDDGLFSFFFFK